MRIEHTSKTITPELDYTGKGIKTLKISLLGLLATGILQVIIYMISNSAALLADTIHNFADALTAIPLWIAFVLSRRKPTRSLTYGYGRAEDVAGIFIVIVILISAIVALNESISKFIEPETITNTGWVIAAGIIGFIGNEIVAQYRINTGKEIGSAALVADGKHSRIDGLTSLGVIVGALGVMWSFPILDPVIGIIISILIFGIVYDSAKEILKRLMDFVDPQLLDEIESAAKEVEEVKSVHDVKARWIGHELRVDISIAVAEKRSVKEGHDIAVRTHAILLNKIPHLRNITIHVDPDSEIGELKHSG
jgi:cation diffusion facilitator family transporter